MLLQVVELRDSSCQLIQVQRYFRNQNDIRLGIGRAKSDVSRLSSHHFHDSDASMTFGCRPQSLNRLCDHENRRRIARGRVINDVVQPHCVSCRNTFLNEATACFGCVNPLVGFVDVIQAKIVIDCFRSEHTRQNFSDGLHAIDRAVAADADETVQFELFNVSRHQFKVIYDCCVEVSA